MKALLLCMCASGLLLPQDAKANPSRAHPLPKSAQSASTQNPKGKADIPTLIKMLKDKNVVTRRGAALSLAVIENPAPEAVPALVEALRDDDGEIRRQCAMALGRIGPLAKGAMPGLRKALKDQDPKVRWRAAFALFKVDAKCAEEVSWVIANATLSLSENEEKEAGEALIDVLYQMLLNKLQESEAKPKK
jgi:HEAT repeat protein